MHIIQTTNSRSSVNNTRHPLLTPSSLPPSPSSSNPTASILSHNRPPPPPHPSQSSQTASHFSSSPSPSSAAVPIFLSTSRSTNSPSHKALAYLSMAASHISKPPLCFDKKRQCSAWLIIPSGTNTSLRLMLTTCVSRLLPNTAVRWIYGYAKEALLEPEKSFSNTHSSIRCSLAVSGR